MHSLQCLFLVRELSKRGKLTVAAPGSASVPVTRAVRFTKSLVPYTVKAPVVLVPPPPSLELVRTMAVNRVGQP